MDGKEPLPIQWTFLLVVFVLFSIIFVIRNLPRLMARVPFVRPADLKERMDKGDDLLVLDVRTAPEFEGGHVRGALNLPVQDLGTRLGEINKDELEALKATPVFIMCASGSRAAQAARILKNAGFSDLTVVDGGYNKWCRQKLPTT